MPMIYLHQNVPSVYTEESRDFQLFCRLYDCIENGVKYNINSITEIIDTNNCDIMLLQLLQTKVGFFTDKQFSDDMIRPVLESFPYLIKNKGSLKAIKQAVNLFLKINKLKASAIIEIINKKNDENYYQVRVGIGTDYVDPSLLTEIFRFILPTGYDIYYYFYKENDMDALKLIFKDDVQFIILNEEESAKVVDIGFGDIGSVIGLSESYANPELSDTVNVVKGYYKDDKFFSTSDYSAQIHPIIKSNSIFYKDLNYTLETGGTKFYIYNPTSDSGTQKNFQLIKPRLRIKVPKSSPMNEALSVSAVCKYNENDDPIEVYDGYEFNNYFTYADEQKEKGYPIVEYNILKSGSPIYSESKILRVDSLTPTIYFE